MLPGGECFAAADTSRCDIQVIEKDHVIIPPMPDAFWSPSGSIRKVRDGLTLTVEQKLELVQSNEDAKAWRKRRCRLSYDLWAEHFILQDELVYSDASGSPVIMPQESRVFQNKDGLQALRSCLAVMLLNAKFNEAKGQVLINPVDKEQEKKTRDWLATKGVGGVGSGILGRAMGAVMNLNAESVVDYECRP